MDFYRIVFWGRGRGRGNYGYNVNCKEIIVSRWMCFIYIFFYVKYVLFFWLVLFLVDNINVFEMIKL